MKINKEKLIASLVYWGIFSVLIVIIMAILIGVEYVFIDTMGFNKKVVDGCIIATILVLGIYVKYKYPKS